VTLLQRWLAHPLTRGLDIDDPATTRLRQRIVRQKGVLSRIYFEWYSAIAAALPAGDGPVLELGAGGGFMGEHVPHLITSERFRVPHVSVVLDGLRLPFAAESLRGIVMTNVLHHLPEPRGLFVEATRCVRGGGAIVMIEPWVTPWSRFVYQRLHHEPFVPEAASWSVAGGGPLSAANGALPWIMFERDRPRFEREFPAWRIDRVTLMMPFVYLLSGGVSQRSLVPGWSFAPIRALERALSPWRRQLAMFALIVLRRLDYSHTYTHD
jgi:hypothetical protein